MVSQDVHLFSTSVAENIAYGRPGAGRDEVLEAAKRAQASQLSRRFLKDMKRTLANAGCAFPVDSASESP